MVSGLKWTNAILRALWRLLRARVRRKRLSPRMLGPFERRDLRPVPQEWRCDGPDFVGVATPKGGTSWWYNLILKHPQVVPNRMQCKELTYFQHFGYRELSEDALETYRQAFAAPGGKICGEWSPGYLTDPFAIEHLMAAAPNAKLLVILRNPIDRAVSQLNQLVTARSRFFRVRGSRRHVFEVFSLFPMAFLRSPYAPAIRGLFNRIPRSQVLVLQYESCKERPARDLAETFRFLGIDDGFVPDDLTRRVNKKPYIVPTPDVGDRRRLADFFSADVQELAGLLPEIDLSLWPEFERAG